MADEIIERGTFTPVPKIDGRTLAVVVNHGGYKVYANGDVEIMIGIRYRRGKGKPFIIDGVPFGAAG